MTTAPLREVIAKLMHGRLRLSCGHEVWQPLGGPLPKCVRCHQCARDAYRASLAPYVIEHTAIISVTDMSVLVRVLWGQRNTEVWVPRSVILPESAVIDWPDAGRLVVAGWFAVEQRWPNAGAAAQPADPPPTVGQQATLSDGAD